MKPAARGSSLPLVTGSRTLQVIANPEAGGGRGRKVALSAAAALEQVAADFDLLWTEDADHVPVACSEAARSGDLPVVVGGDGTVASAAGALVGGDTPLGIIPAGRGNDLARILGIPKRTRLAVEVICRGATRRLDVGEANGRRFLGIASLGFDSDANEIANRARLLRGPPVYAYAALRALLGWRAARFEIEFPGGEVEAYEGWSVAVANNSTYGGGMLIAPDARLDDGALDVVMVSGTNRMRFTAMFPRIYRGTHVSSPEVDVRRATSVVVRASRPFTVYADGDAICQLPMRASVIPAAVSILCPAP